MTAGTAGLLSALATVATWTTVAADSVSFGNDWTYDRSRLGWDTFAFGVDAPSLLGGKAGAAPLAKRRFPTDLKPLSKVVASRVGAFGANLGILAGQLIAHGIGDAGPAYADGYLCLRR